MSRDNLKTCECEKGNKSVELHLGIEIYGMVEN